MTYERKVGRELKRRSEADPAGSSLSLSGMLELGSWFAFRDINGLGYAQPDAFVVGEFVLLFEIKLTQTDSAEDQLFRLYAPLLRHFFCLPVVCVQVCKNLRYRPRNLILDPTEASREHVLYTWHWIGN